MSALWHVFNSRRVHNFIVEGIVIFLELEYKVGQYCWRVAADHVANLRNVLHCYPSQTWTSFTDLICYFWQHLQITTVHLMWIPKYAITLSKWLYWIRASSNCFDTPSWMTMLSDADDSSTSMMLPNRLLIWDPPVSSENCWKSKIVDESHDCTISWIYDLHHSQANKTFLPYKRRIESPWRHKWDDRSIQIAPISWWSRALTYFEKDSANIAKSLQLIDLVVIWISRLSVVLKKYSLTKFALVASLDWSEKNCTVSRRWLISTGSIKGANIQLLSILDPLDVIVRLSKPNNLSARRELSYDGFCNMVNWFCGLYVSPDFDLPIP